MQTTLGQWWHLVARWVALPGPIAPHTVCTLAPEPRPACGRTPAGVIPSSCTHQRRTLRFNTARTTTRRECSSACTTRTSWWRDWSALVLGPVACRSHAIGSDVCALVWARSAVGVGTVDPRLIGAFPRLPINHHLDALDDRRRVSPLGLASVGRLRLTAGTAPCACE